MQRTTQRLHRWWIVFQAYIANMEPSELMQTEQKTYPRDAKVAAIHKLRVNVKSLAAEAKIIRQEAWRCGPAYEAELTMHRRGRLREESRYAQLALAFVRGVPYLAVERNAKEKPVYDKLFDKIRGFYRDVNHVSDPLGQWLNG
jgi:hypothetical protein